MCCATPGGGRLFCYSCAAESISKPTCELPSHLSTPSSSLLSPHHRHFKPSTSPWGGGGGPSLSLIITHSPHYHPQAHHLLCTEVMVQVLEVEHLKKPLSMTMCCAILCFEPTVWTWPDLFNDIPVFSIMIYLYILVYWFI